MRTTQFHLSTLKETPADAEIVSHQLMLRAGLVRRLASGLYSWLPLGLKVLRNVENIVREEMNKAGCLEVLMPSVQPAELWQESGRWAQYGPELLRFNDRHNREFCYGPTHEEVITDLFRKEVKSYKQLPITFYQIQTKFRDEIRPRFGIMRSREFIMKDAYSFHLTNESLQQTYDIMFDCYCKIFERFGLKYRPVKADTGSIGGNASHEFHVLADSGEDAIVFSDGSDYAANVELAEAVTTDIRAEAKYDLSNISTPNQRSIEDISKFLNIPATQTVKTLIVVAEDGNLIALVLRGDHQLNDIKAEKLDLIKHPLTMAEPTAISKAIGCDIGSIGPVKLNLPIIVDRSAAVLSDFCCGANINDQHLQGVNWDRDIPDYRIEDIRNVVNGDPSPEDDGTLSIARGIEVGHIFQLGQKYSKALQANVLDEHGKAATATMGCYGIGVSRIVAAAVEQSNDENGIIWSDSLAPFQLVICPLNYQKSDAVKATADELYQYCLDNNWNILLDDRKMRPGAMFSDMELIGIPHRIVLSDRGLKNEQFEYKGRSDDNSSDYAISELKDFVKSKFQPL